MRSWIHHAKGRHVRQARVGLGDLREEHISRQGFFAFGVARGGCTPAMVA